MSSEVPKPDLVLVERPLARVELRRLLAAHFEDMVEFVVDVARGIAAVGGELQADEEALLLEHGSRQEDLWGANDHPLINTEPAHANRSRSRTGLCAPASARSPTT